LTKITIPDGYYDVETLNEFLQNIFILNSCYVTIGSGDSLQNVYFAELKTVPNSYGITMNLYGFIYNSSYKQISESPLHFPTGVPMTTGIYTFKITFYNGLGTLLGFPDNQSYGGVISNTDSSPIIFKTPAYGIPYLSPFTPCINPVNCYIMACNLISNKFSSLPTTMFSIPLTATFGGLISVSPTLTSEYLHDIKGGSYSAIEISFYDQNLNLLQLQDSQVLILLCLME